MSHSSGRAGAIRGWVLAGAAVLALGSLTATAQAFPVQRAAPAAAGIEPAQFYGEGHRRLDHRLYGENAHPRHPGHAGLYDCGPGGKNTRLSRKNCGGNDRFAHLRRQNGRGDIYD